MFQKRTPLVDDEGRDGLQVLLARLRDRHTCQMCGAKPGERSEFDGAALHLLARVMPEAQSAGTLRVDDLRTVCSDCAEGLAAMWEADRCARNHLRE